MSFTFVPNEVPRARLVLFLFGPNEVPRVRVVLIVFGPNFLPRVSLVVGQGINRDRHNRRTTN